MMFHRRPCVYCGKWMSPEEYGFTCAKCWSNRMNAGMHTVYKCDVCHTILPPGSVIDPKKPLCSAHGGARVEADPTGKDPHTPGAKLDAGKIPIFQGVIDYFPRALMAVAEVSAEGAKKYTWKGWEGVPDGMNRYSDALFRHILKQCIGETHDPDTGLLHRAHAAWNALAVLEKELREWENSQDTPSTK